MSYDNLIFSRISITNRYLIFCFQYNYKANSRFTKRVQNGLLTVPVLSLLNE